MRLIGSSGRYLATTLLALAAGCSESTVDDKLPRVPVSGTVTLDGAPLPQGMVQFDPAPDTKGVTAAGEVNGGKFSIEKPQGPVPGKYRIRISSRAPVKIKTGEVPGGTPKPDPEKVPAEYNVKSTLEKDVTDGANTFEFVLGKK